MPSFRPLRQIVGAAALALIAASSAQAQVTWTDWTSAGTGVTGNMGGVGVTYTGSYSFAQLACGTDYYVPNVFTGPGVPNAPNNCEIIALNSGGLKTITFSQAVVNPYLALVSWNGQPPTPFNGPLQVIAQGCGFWGCGTMNASGNTLFTSGEVHGTVQLIGTYNSISFTDGGENWHGITVGANVTATPEPSTYALMATGLVGIFGIARRRRA